MRAPFTGVVFAAELTHRFDALLPLMIGAIAAYAVSVLVLKRSVLTEKIARRGHHLSREYSVDPLEILFVSEVMDRSVLTFEDDLPVERAYEAIAGIDPMTAAQRRQGLYPVVSSQGRLMGVVTRSRIETAIHAGDARTQVAALAIRTPVVTHPDEILRSVALTMAGSEVDRLPVVDRHDSSRVVGMVSLSMLLAGRRRALDHAENAERILLLRPWRAPAEAPTG